MKRLLWLTPIFLMVATVLWVGTQGCHNAMAPAFPPTPTNTFTPTSTATSIYATCTSTTTPVLIDDFEANTNANTAVLSNQCRAGFYFTFGSTANPQMNASIANPGTGYGCSSGSSNNALHLVSGPVTGYGAVFALSPQSGGAAYNITQFKGIQFCGKLGPTAGAVGPNSFQTDDSGSGVLTVTLPAFTTTWSSYSYSFSSMTGTENPALTVRFLWITATTTASVDYFLDNISFY